MADDDAVLLGLAPNESVADGEEVLLVVAELDTLAELDALLLAELVAEDDGELVTDGATSVITYGMLRDATSIGSTTVFSGSS